MFGKTGNTGQIESFGPETVKDLSNPSLKVAFFINRKTTSRRIILIGKVPIS